jgi:hypothetical protein
MTKPTNVVVLLRQLSELSSTQKSIDDYPEWFREEWKKDPNKIWSSILAEAANDVEQMQALAGRLYKQLYG